MRLKLLIILIATSALSAQAEAQAIAQGLGAHNKCDAMIKALDLRGHDQLYTHKDGEVFATMGLAYSAWVQGFISATNAHRPPEGQIKLTPKQIADRMYAYCSKNPQDKIYMGAKNIVETTPPGYRY